MLKKKPIEKRRKKFIERLWKYLFGTIYILQEIIDTDPCTTAEELKDIIDFYLDRNKKLLYQ